MSKFIPRQNRNAQNKAGIFKELASQLVQSAVHQHMTPEELNQIFRAGAALSIAASEYREHFSMMRQTVKRINAAMYINEQLKKIDEVRRAVVLKEFNKELLSMMQEKQVFLAKLDGTAKQVDEVENEYQTRAYDSVFELYNNLMPDPVHAPVNISAALKSIIPDVDSEKAKEYATLLYKAAQMDVSLNQNNLS
jgi:hypothetical protein